MCRQLWLRAVVKAISFSPVLNLISADIKYFVDVMSTILVELAIFDMCTQCSMVHTVHH